MTQVTAPSPPDVTRVEHIAAMTNPVIRNLEITECYADLSAAMRGRLGGAADWCAFATWASRQAGATIRGEDLLALLDRRLRLLNWALAPIAALKRWLLRKGLYQPQTRLGRVLAAVHTPLDAFAHASAEVARGNLRVFEEIGREFARFMAMVPADSRVDSPEFLAFAAGLRQGPPPGGQDCLREAFAAYQRQRHERDPRSRAALILLANLKIGFHEQTRLQPQIAAAVDAPVIVAADLGERVLHLLAPGARRWPRPLHDAAANLAGRVAGVLRREATRVTRQAVTDSMMVLALPELVLALGADLRHPPAPLLDGAPHPLIAAFVGEHDPCPPGGTDCAAADWCDLRQRMHYIVHLFRAFATHPALEARPFRADQVSAFRAGVIPEGGL